MFASKDRILDQTLMKCHLLPMDDINHTKKSKKMSIGLQENGSREQRKSNIRKTNGEGEPLGLSSARSKCQPHNQTCEEGRSVKEPTMNERLVEHKTLREYP
jgi:hypothetical protein